MSNSFNALRLALTLVTAAALAGLCFGQGESLLIGPGDALHIQVFDTPELDQHARVTDSGEVPLMFIGNQKLGGFTPADAARRVEEALKTGKFMKNPQVTVTVEAYATQQVSILGQVNKPGAYPISTPMPILSVLSLAGGLNELADRNITIQRRGDANQKTTYYLSNVADKAFSNDVLVYPGDTVMVPKAGIVYILGDVGRPGGYPMANNESKITVMQALATAGAANKTAVLSKAKLVRKTPNGPQEVPLALAEIEKGKAPDVFMEPEDILYIPSSWLKNVLTNSSSIAASATSALIYSRP
jgi:polysaccharide biosynthesis/export protein